MKTINSRIAWIIDECCNGNRSKFARDVNITPAYAAQLYANERVPSDRTISDICRIFNVNERWLREGTEPKFMPEPDDDTDYINELLSDSDNPFVGLIKSIMHVYMELSPEDKKKFADFANSLRDEIKKENRD